MADNASLQTSKLRLRYENFFELGMADDKGTRFYEGTLIVTKADWDTPEMKRIRAACEAALKKKFPAATPEELAEMKRPFRKCATKPKAYGPEFADCLFFKVKSKNKPGVVGPDAKTQMHAGDVVAGDYVRVSVNPFAYDNKGNKGVSLWMNNVQKLGEGVRLSGGARAEDEFTPVESADVGEDVDAMFASDA